MMPRLLNYLSENNIPYSTITHAPAYTAQQIAASAHIPGKKMAKTVIIQSGDQYAMVVLPANKKVDLNLFKVASGWKEANIANEYQFIDRFPDCEAGAMPPFGNLYGMEVFIDPDLTHGSDIFFNGGTHSELIKVSFEDYSRLVHPHLLKEVKEARL